MIEEKDGTYRLIELDGTPITRWHTTRTGAYDEYASIKRQQKPAGRRGGK